MMYIDFAAGGKNYKLRLTTRSIILLEERLGYNPLHIFGNGETAPKVTVMVDVLFASLQHYHNVSLDEAYEIFDAWMEDGNTPPEFLPILIEVYRVSGLIKKKN